MNEINIQLKALYNRIPRRHSADNVKEIYNILEEFEEVLKTLEANADPGKDVAHYFDALDTIRATVKKSNDNKASKKTKDLLFDEASGELKDIMEAVMKQ